MFLDRNPDMVSAARAANHLARRADRISFDMLVRYAWYGHRATAMLKDLTRFGARIEGISGLRKGDFLTLLLPDLQPIEASVAWAEGLSAGLSFETPVPAAPFDELVRNFATERPDASVIPQSNLPHAA